MMTWAKSTADSAEVVVIYERQSGDRLPWITEKQGARISIVRDLCIHNLIVQIGEGY